MPVGAVGLVAVGALAVVPVPVGAGAVGAVVAEVAGPLKAIAVVSVAVSSSSVV